MSGQRQGNVRDGEGKLSAFFQILANLSQTLFDFHCHNQTSVKSFQKTFRKLSLNFRVISAILTLPQSPLNHDPHHCPKHCPNHCPYHCPQTLSPIIASLHGSMPHQEKRRRERNVPRVSIWLQETGKNLRTRPLRQR